MLTSAFGLIQKKLANSPTAAVVGRGSGHCPLLSPIEKALPTASGGARAAVRVLQTSCLVRTMRLGWGVLGRLRKESCSVVREQRASTIWSQENCHNGKQVSELEMNTSLPLVRIWVTYGLAFPFVFLSLGFETAAVYKMFHHLISTIGFILEYVCYITNIP